MFARDYTASPAFLRLEARGDAPRAPEPAPGAERRARERFVSLPDVLRGRAEGEGAREAFDFLSYRAGEVCDVASLSYRQLEQRARAIACRLQQRVAKGERAMILCAPGLDYVAAFYGCMMAGVVAVPAYPPRNARHMGRLATILADAGATAVLTTADLCDRLRAWAGDAFALPFTLAVDTLAAAEGAGWRDPHVASDDLAFLQYTSGTTGAPKGVMVRHVNLMANVVALARVAEVDERAVLSTWVPPYHDMGLIAGLVLGVVAGNRAVLMAPMSFLQRPARWLQAISAFRATHITAPNFAYQLCVDQTAAADMEAIDLHALKYAYCGAEVVRPATLNAFSTKFRTAGFRAQSFQPTYGMAETVLLAASVGATATRLPKTVRANAAALLAGRLAVEEAAEPSASAIAIVSCGAVIADHALRIVDPELGRECAAGEVGEIWLSGPSVAAGYWRHAQATQATFNARIACANGGDASRDFLRTGDLGAVVAGELYVLGRIKEMIIIRGQNHYATDLEATASSSHAALGADRMIAFALEADSEERLALVHELTRASMRDLDCEAAFQAIRATVTAGHGIDPYRIVFVRPATLPRTSSGKLQRGAARAQYQAGELAIVAEWRAAPEATPCARVESDAPMAEALAAPDRGEAGAAALAAIIARELQTILRLPAAPDRATPFFDLGMDSLLAVRFAMALEQAAGQPVAAETVLEHPTVAALAQALTDAAEERPAAARNLRAPPGADRGATQRTDTPPGALGGIVNQGTLEPAQCLAAALRLFPGAGPSAARRPDIRTDILSMLYSTLWDGIDFGETIPAGRHIFICNHQTVLDIALFCGVIAGLRQEKMIVVGWENVGFIHTGDLFQRIAAHPGNANGGWQDSIRLDLVDDRPQEVAKLFSRFSAQTGAGGASLTLAGDGRLQKTDREDIRNVSTMLLQIADEQDITIYPVRFLWGSPTDALGYKAVLPYRFRPQRAVVGRALTPQALAGMTLAERRDAVLASINGLYREMPTGHGKANEALYDRVRGIQEKIGMSATKAFLCDRICAAERGDLSEEGALIQDFLREPTLIRQFKGYPWFHEFSLWLSEGTLFSHLPLAQMYAG